MSWSTSYQSHCTADPNWAYFIQELVDQHYPHAEKIRLVMDNLNTHTKASLYEAFAPPEAKRIADK